MHFSASPGELIMLTRKSRLAFVCSIQVNQKNRWGTFSSMNGVCDVIQQRLKLWLKITEKNVNHAFSTHPIFPVS
jgi:hypothetical protein